ncbi:MAG: pyridoxal phosphate-dependent aminotransferase, partial [Euryarchaeota archaeon]|nr:pyridoxal phosphate-dependent aminotransferase [Euryarchaeota archaeon]MBU4144418.1 pyridoxal phosphate-dependent aminotransferase [Candidatus Thermoplasmatota archaeon]
MTPKEPEKLSPFDFAHTHAQEIVWMSQNTNHIPVSDVIDQAILEAVKKKEYNLYPRSTGIFGLCETVKEHLCLPEDYEVLITNGGIEAMYILTRALIEKGDEIICSDPSFLPLHHQIRISGGVPVEIPILQDPWKLTPEQIRKAITPNSKMILLIDPLNPMGTAYNHQEVKEICEIAGEHDLLIVDDITYRDFSDPVPTYKFIPERSLVTYTFSKQCGLAGMRIGVLAASKPLMEKMLPYNTNVLSVNILAQRAALAAMTHIKEWLPGMRAQLLENQRIIKEAIDSVDGCFLPVYPSRTNMFIADISATGVNPDELQNKLLYDHKVFIRSGNYVSTAFGKGFIRISFSVTQEGAEKFAKVFPKV